MTRQDIELYVMGQYDGDVAALERAIADDPALAQMVAEEARLEELMRDAATLATFCPACDDLVRDTRCDACGAAVKPGGYAIERVLVSNAHGRMYVAHDADGRRVALKELAFVQAPSPAAVAAFEREAKFLRALEHPAIPRFLASFEEGSGVHTRYYLAQELVEGTALDRLDEHWYTEAEITALAHQVLAVIAYLQSLSPMVIHRDIKPANLIKRADGSIAVVDFGAAHAHGTTAGVTTVGTFGYMPIEQLAGLVDTTTDLYALGMTLLHLLTRQEPWRLVQSKVEVNVSPQLRAYLAKLTAADPKARFASAKDALAALDAPAAVAVPTKRRRPALIAAAAAVAFAAAGGGVFAIAHHAHDAGHAKPSAGGIGTLHIDLPMGVTAKLAVDGTEVGSVQAGMDVPVVAGTHHLTASNGAGQCVVDETIVANQVVDMRCALPLMPAMPEMPEIHTMPPMHAHLHMRKRVSWTLEHVKLHDFALLAANTCGFSVVIPATIDIPISVSVKDAPCGTVFDAVLSAQGLDYSYDEDSQLVRIGVRKELEEDAMRFHTPADGLPDGAKLDIDFKDAPLREVLSVIVKAGGHNIVVPESIDGRVTVKLSGAPWNHALEAVLASQGLWYRYRPDGKLILVGVRKELDEQDARGR
jgi:serine/threonine protein kinase